MEPEGVSLPLIHKHLMVPWNHLGKGDCCGRFDAITDGYFCESCEFFVHKKCSESSEYIQHPSHSGHTLQLQSNPRGNNCNLCGRRITDLFYHCEICDFNVDLSCTSYPPPEVIDNSESHRRKLTLLKKCIDFDCDAGCGKTGENEFAYKCDKCDLAFHVDCVWHPLEVKHPLEYTTMDAGKRVSLPWIHKHFMIPWNDVRKDKCCGRYQAITDGYYCKRCDLFLHKKCADEAPESAKHPSHSVHLLWLRSTPKSDCSLCGRRIVDIFYRCEICDFNVDLYCFKYPPPEIIPASETDGYKLILLKKRTDFNCDLECGKISYGFPYTSNEYDINFHVDCLWEPSKLEVNHSYHFWHPLTVLTGQPPEYSDGKCSLCGRKINDRLYYHCFSCNFTLDMRCVLKPPPQSLMDLKAHDHQLTLLPRVDSFTCNACGLKGDRSPYACIQCGFMIHQDCLDLPRVININRHDHRIFRTSVLGVVNSVCGVCHKKVDWTCGGYSCQKCSGYVVHSKCATREDVWNGKELEGVPEEIEDLEPYVVIDKNTIQHFSHKDHYLRFSLNGGLWEQNKRCSACNHPIGLQSSYGCIDCDFVLHQNCAEFPKKKRHVLHNERLILLTSKANFFKCDACGEVSNGFMYKHGEMKLDVWCATISEPFIHPSHLHHPLYYTTRNKNVNCSGCRWRKLHVLRCIEDDCKFVLCFGCATLPQVVKHRIHDHPLSLCYREEEEASGKYWCDICEKESDPKKWFYTCKDHLACLHTWCVLGDVAGLRPGNTIKIWSFFLEVVLNDSISRPYCQGCWSRCMHPIILKRVGTLESEYICCYDCIF